MSREKFDIVNEVLEACILAYPVSSFVISLYQQYQKRGSLSKKQLQGLFGKASAIPDFSHAKLATLEALINKMPTRYKSELPKVVEQKEDEESINRVKAILEIYPQHKQVLFLQSKIQKRIPLTASDRSDLLNFYTVAMKISEKKKASPNDDA